MRETYLAKAAQRKKDKKVVDVIANRRRVVIIFDDSTCELVSEISMDERFTIFNLDSLVQKHNGNKDSIILEIKKNIAMNAFKYDPMLISLDSPEGVENPQLLDTRSYEELNRAFLEMIRAEGDLGNRACNVIARAYSKSVLDKNYGLLSNWLLNKSNHEVRNIYGFGKSTLNYVYAALKKHGYSPRWSTAYKQKGVAFA